MNEHDFERQLRADGFDEIEHQDLDPRPGKGRHRHHFEIRGLVISGTFVVRQTGEPVVYRSGQIFSVAEGELHEAFDQFLAHYAANIAVHSRPYEGVERALRQFKGAGAKLAVCTNKNERLARELLDTLGLSSSMSAIAGRDTFSVFKPDPGHLTGTISMAGGSRGRAIMIGDSDVDIATAKAAGIPVVAVTFGYMDRPVREFGPDAVIEHYDELGPAIYRLLDRM